MKRLLVFILLLAGIATLLGLGVTQTISNPNNTLSANDELYRQRLVTINSRPLGDGLLVDPKSGFPFDNGYIKETDEVEGLGEYTSPTNIGLYLTYLLGVSQELIQPFYEFSPEMALERIYRILSTLDAFPAEDKWEGLYYWMVYEKGKWVRAADGHGNYVISQPDNGNLFGAFLTVLGGMELALSQGVEDKHVTAWRVEIKRLAKKLILEANWKPLMDPERELYYLAYIPDIEGPLRFGGDHVGGAGGSPIYVENLMDEWRLGVLIAYAVSDLPGSQSHDIPITTWTGLDREKRAFDVGGGKKIEALASGHGGMFQQRLPLIFIPEGEWSSVFKDNHQNFFAVAANFAQSRHQPFLLSAASNPEGKVEYIELGDNPRFAVDTTYDEFGTKPLALKLEEEFNIIRTVGDRPIGDITTFHYASTPHALALGFLTNPEEVIALFKKAEMSLKIFTFPGGIPDAFGVQKGRADRVSFRTLILNQLMLVLSLQGTAFHDDFEAGLKSIGAYDKARQLYRDETKFYPRLYPLKRDQFPKIDTNYQIYLGTSQRNYGTAIKLVRQLAIEHGFKILNEKSEQILADKISKGLLDKKDIRSFFQGNLLALSIGENGTFKPRRNDRELNLPKIGGWIGDRVPLVDFRGVESLRLEVEPVSTPTRLTLELKDRKGKPLFKESKIKVTIPPDTQVVTIPLPKRSSTYLAYLVVADTSAPITLRNLRITYNVKREA